MADLKETIQGLTNCTQPTEGVFCICTAPVVCPYVNTEGCEWHLMNDALSLLKAQEPKMVRCVRRLIRVMKGVCPACEMEIESVRAGIRITKFCKFCGQAVKWDE